MPIDDDVGITYNGDDLEFPAHIEVGTPLKDGKGEQIGDSQGALCFDVLSWSDEQTSHRINLEPFVNNEGEERALILVNHNQENFTKGVACRERDDMDFDLSCWLPHQIVGLGTGNEMPLYGCHYDF